MFAAHVFELLSQQLIILTFQTLFLFQEHNLAGRLFQLVSARLVSARIKRYRIIIVWDFL